MKNSESTKTGIANQLRAFAENPILEFSLGAIEGLGELGGTEAVQHIEELMDVCAEKSGDDERKKWAALLRAYGRAARSLD